MAYDWLVNLRNDYMTSEYMRNNKWTNEWIKSKKKKFSMYVYVMNVYVMNVFSHKTKWKL